MGRPKGTKKDPFAALPAEFKNEVDGMTEAEARERISRVALTQVNLDKAKKEDGDLIEKQEAVKDALEPYKIATKENRLKILYCREVLKNHGKNVDFK